MLLYVLFANFMLLTSSSAAILDHSQAPLDVKPDDSSPSLSPYYTEELLSLHKSLIEIESISGNEEKVGKWLEDYLKGKGFDVERQEALDNRYNVLAWTKDVKSIKDVAIIVSSHIDTVPPFIPYSYHSENKTIAGRGSVDAKASVAAQIIAVLSVLESTKLERTKPPSIGLLFVVDEEAGGRGMKYFSDSDLNSKKQKAIIFGEPTEGNLCAGHKGITMFHLEVQGRAAHSGYPWLGLSANDVLVQALAKLKQLEAAPGKHGFPASEKYGNTTLNIGTISGGVAGNVVAESASAAVAIRIAAGTPQQIRDIVQKALEPIKAEVEEQGGTVKMTSTQSGYGPVNIDCDIEGFECITVNYGTDVPNLDMADSTKRYLYGPGTILVAHGANEAISIDDLKQAVVDYVKLINKVSR